MEKFVSDSGYIAIFGFMLLSSACIPIPSEVVMLFGGALTAPGSQLGSTGKLSLVPVILVGLAGNLVGSYIAWGLGWIGGRPAVLKVGKWVRIKTHDIERAEAWFERHGESSVLLGRMVPVIRSFISLPAGVTQMPALRFGLYTLVGATIYTVGLGVGGYELGNNWHSILRWFDGATYAIVVVVVAVAVAYYGLRIARSRRRAASESSRGPHE